MVKKPRRKYTIGSIVSVDMWNTGAFIWQGEIVYRISPFKFFVLIDNVRMKECHYTQLKLVSRKGEQE